MSSREREKYAQHLVPIPLLDGEWRPLLSVEVVVVVVILISAHRIID